MEDIRKRKASGGSVLRGPDDGSGYIYVMHCDDPRYPVAKPGKARWGGKTRMWDHGRVWGRRHGLAYLPMVIDTELHVPNRHLFERFILWEVLRDVPRVEGLEWFAIDVLEKLVNLVKYGNLGNLDQPREIRGMVQRT